MACKEKIKKAEHPFLASRNEENYLPLMGRVLCSVNFVNDPENIWKEDEKQEFLDTFRNAMNWIVNEATTDRVNLSFLFKQDDLFSNRIIKNPREKTDTDFLLSQFVAAQKKEGFQSYMDYIRKYHVDHIVVFLVYKSAFREYVRWSPVISCDVASLHAQSSLFTIIHETLHLFGARDYYYPDSVRRVAEYCFQNSLMLSSSRGSQIDSLSRYLVGWRKELDPAACFFLSYTEGLTSTQLLEANRLQTNTEQYYNEILPFPNFQKLQESAHKKHPWANFLLGFCYQHGILVAKDTVKAKECYESSGETDVIIADYALLETIISEKKELSESETRKVKVLAEQVSGKHPWAMSLLAVCLYTGYLFEQDRERALALTMSKYRNHGYFTKNMPFVKMDRAYQQYLIAARYCCQIPEIHYEMNRLVQKYERIDMTGDQSLYYIMGNCLQKGVLPKNEKRALELFKISANAGFSLACAAVARCYLYGIGTEIDLIEGQQWKAKALVARQNEDAGNTTLANYLLRCAQF